MGGYIQLEIPIQKLTHKCGNDWPKKKQNVVTDCKIVLSSQMKPHIYMHIHTYLSPWTLSSLPHDTSPVFHAVTATSRMAVLCLISLRWIWCCSYKMEPCQWSHHVHNLQASHPACTNIMKLCYQKLTLIINIVRIKLNNLSHFPLILKICVHKEYVLYNVLLTNMTEVLHFLP